MNSYVKRFRDLEVPSGGARRSCPTRNECLRRVGQLRPRNADGETRTMITDY